MKIGILGNGSWATALAKILTDNANHINWCVRSEKVLQHILHRKHNLNYLSSVYFNTELLNLVTDPAKLVHESDCVLVAVPSAYVTSVMGELDKKGFDRKYLISAVKGILPEKNLLLNEWMNRQFGFDRDRYFTIMGPCHAEEVAAEKLSYLTFSGNDMDMTRQIASHFNTEYLNLIINNDIYGVQYAAVLKNIYALGAGLAHGLEYGDNFLSVLIANSADEMAGFLRKVGIRHIEVGIHEPADPVTHRKSANYAASVYLGDLLVTCYSPYSRNRSFGNMIGKGYSVQTARLEMNMVAEGYNASKCIYLVNKEVKAEMPIAETIYRVLWENVKPESGMKQIESFLV